jgi:thiol-disulfide isomerase/thioredoxin
MKQLLILFALLAGLTAQAQLPDGSICPDWTGTDINGNTWNLYDILDEGKQVVIDVSATWCGPCWNYHQTGTLDQLMEEHGPDGTDDLMVFWIEGDAETTLADIQGTGGNTQGDWTEGTTFPIIDDASIGDLLAVNAFPTIYLVCPNRVITEVGQANAATIWNAASAATCQSATYAVDPAMVDVTTSGDGCTGIFSANVDFMNLGTTNLSSATVTANGCDNCPLSIDWSGDIETYGIVSLSMTGIQVSGDQDITFNVTAPDDGEVNNNTISKLLYSSDHNTHFRIIGTTDNWPQEASWVLRDGSGNIVQSGGNYSNDGNGTPVNIYHNFFVNGDLGCWEFTWVDSYGDGMHGSQWGGIDGFVTVETIDSDGTRTFYSYDGSYDFIEDTENGTVTTISLYDGSCLLPEGCTNPEACNFDPDAECDNGTCSFPGCTNPEACNFNFLAGCEGEFCTFPGCTNPIACNFSSIAGCDDGTCIFPDGCTVPTACNYDSNAACDDNSCTFPGCTDPETVNYDPTAGCDDGSCIPAFGSFAINAPESTLYSDTLEIEVVVNNGQNIYGLFASLEYDTEHFEFVGSTLGDYLGSEVLASPPVDAAGSIEFGASKLGQQAGSNGDGLFYTLQFVPISSVLGGPILVDFSLSASDAFNADGISGELFLPETLSVELIFEAEVWPGDLNHDGVVDVADILPIGYFYDITGPERPNASLAWEAQNCQIWSTGADFPGDGFYRVFADGNGDGVVNLADQVAVGFNIDQIVSLNAGQSNLEMLAFAQNTSLTVPISNEVTPAQINVPGTETITVQFIATTSAVDAETLFGFTMNIDLSPLGILASDAEIDFTSSEFGVLNESLITQTYGQGSQLNVAITRTSPNSIVGGILLFELTLPLSSSLGANIYTLPVSIGTANDPTGQITLLNVEDVQFAVNSPFGCTDSTACNYNADATEDNGSCLIVGAACDDNNSETSNDIVNEDCICAGETIVEVVSGCTDLNACNYNVNANQDDGSCFSIGELCDDNNPATENDMIQDNCLCEGEEILIIQGCTDPEACNFNEEANVDDESCTYVATFDITGTNIPQAFSTQNYAYTNTAGSTYQWSITGGVIVSGQGSSSIEVVWSSEGGGSIDVVETNEDGCVGDAASFDVVILPTNVFEQTQQSINIFPNPASTSVTITVDESLINAIYQLFDAQGKLVSEGVLTKTTTTLNATAFAAGNYVISIGNDHGVMRQQLIIER